MLKKVLVVCIIIGLLFIFFVFFGKKGKNIKEHFAGRIVNYNTEWCGYSKQFQPTWDKFTEAMKAKHPEVAVIDMKCDKEENEAKCKVPEVQGFPTVILYDENNKSKVYNGPRTLEKLMEFVEK
jgi:hypothetical protein